MKEYFTQFDSSHIKLLKSLVGKTVKSLYVEVNNFNERETKHFKSFNFVYMEIDEKIYSLELWKGDVTPSWLEVNEDSSMADFQFKEVPEIDYPLMS